MNSDFPRFTKMGERSILIEFEPEISYNGLEKLLFFKNKLEKYYSKVKVEVINTYCSLLINYIFNIENIYSEFKGLKELLEDTNITKNNNYTIFHIPVCYNEKYGLDLQLISTHNKLSVLDIITLHTAPIYTVYFIGFLPGFLYLGGLDKRLQISRKNEPRLMVEKGAVGIGEKQTGIYPKSSPGGWQIIGNSPVQLFDKNSNPPCQIYAGDKVKFYQVSLEEHDEIMIEKMSGNFQLKSEEING